ncbi:DUF6252 family protein [uncultured Tenacibaculum sp.]|uniref:DUF6252 family protein n=1 Tax=uncultured Tenacibaculum sp. TaxID=174713 RepID=UPI002625BBD4|nr:DUF6252 family protein [uncultured Tenacibaculum sp.]
MKKLKQLQSNIIMFFALLVLTSCSTDDIIKPQTELPPITQTGANTVGCLVDGKVFLPRTNNPLGNPVVTCFYQFVNNQWHFSLGFSNNQKENLRGVNIGSKNISLKEGQSYDLLLDSGNNAFATYFDFVNPDFTTTNEVTGKILISKIDSSQSIISGTFWFDAVNSNGEIIKIRDGRFDMIYTP